MVHRYGMSTDGTIGTVRVQMVQVVRGTVRVQMVRYEHSDVTDGTV